MEQKKDQKHLSLRISPELLKKFDYVAGYDDRSMNWMLLSLIKKCVAEFEEQHGKIDIDE
jgi:hypothetical protein